MALKFVSAQKPTDYANRLHKLQQEITARKKELKLLEAEAHQLEVFLVRYAGSKSFVYDGPRYQMKVSISVHTRMILDQEQTMKLLKKKTPYKESSWTTCKVDYVYKD